MTLRRRPPEGNVKRVAPQGLNSRGVATNKRGRTVQYGSFAQRRLILTLERDSSVFDYSSQPENIEYVDRNGKVRAYTPHFIVWRQDGQVEWHHVSGSSRDALLHTDIQDRDDAAREICTERGWQFIVHNNDDLPQKTLLANLQALDCFEPTCYRDDDVALQAIAQLSSSAGKSMRFQTLSREIAQVTGCPLATVSETLYHMLWHGEIEADLDKLLFDYGDITPKTVIWLPSNTQERIA